MDFASMTNEALAEALTEARQKATELFALTEPTIEQVNEAETLVASIRDIESEQSTRAEAVRDAADRFAAARSAFSVNDGVEVSDEDDDEEAEEDEAEEDAEEVEEADEEEAEEDDEDDDAEDGAVTASARNAQRVPVSAARRVARKTKRPAVAAASPVTITASADIPGFSTGQSLDGMDQVTKALMNRVKGFAPFNKAAARAANSASGGQPVLNKYGVASFGLEFDASLVASSGNDYNAVRNAIKARAGDGSTLTAAGWCAPSEPVYSYIADYVVDGLVSVPEVSAPRGGLLLTTGPARSSQGTALDGFGFVQTEAQAEAGTEKTCETIECPDFEPYRLDAIGYCYKIPLLTQKAYPELITDALRFANVLYAHKVNARVISDMVALSDPLTTYGLGATVTDTLEALAVIATRRRRKWNIGENAVMEVKVPVIAREIFRADMSRRTGLALSDVATDQKIDAEFAARRLAVEYVADWQEEDTDANAGVIPDSFQAMIYPAGTFIKAVEDVINLSAVYDAASLTINEYTGVFFEQGILVAKAGYGSDLVTIPVCSAGLTGAAALNCEVGSL